MKMIKLVLIGFIITMLRAMLQPLMPVGHQTVLSPSMFINNGSMPIVFILYGTFAYTMIAVIFLFLHKNLSGNRIIKGLKFGILYSLLWSIYLMEPLAHGAPIDKITYPIIDSAVLIVMGLLLGRFIAQSSPIEKHKLTKRSLLDIGFITVLFFIGRMIEYTIFNIYSSFNKSPVSSIVWVIGTGIVIGLVFDYINPLIGSKSTISKSFIFGFIIFGVDLIAFNFFIPIVFNFNILDLFIRTIIDIVFVFIGSYIVNKIRDRK
ncbi:MAG: hypothetical protein H7Y18_10510 [Clostridiaceae bacterium]|nr:hypothetical protein [Clostridiaceae bacterium]